MDVKAKVATVSDPLFHDFTAIKIVVIGYGGIVSCYAHNIMTKENKRVHVVETYDILGERQKMSGPHNHRLYCLLEEALTNETIEAVLSTTPNNSHKELVRDTLKDEKNVVYEKIFTMNVEENKEVF
ncbi:Gfo/Idh/MocA family oxidoreductase [Enterococcus sp. DIV0724b]|uniref:Gfo/Idh/MocA family oxidoreductase n=1 Tax=Enterococcus sp. DIV0724b TaxID=2774694 RepID=UPI003D2FF865